MIVTTGRNGTLISLFNIMNNTILTNREKVLGLIAVFSNDFEGYNSSLVLLEATILTTKDVVDLLDTNDYLRFVSTIDADLYVKRDAESGDIVTFNKDIDGNEIILDILALNKDTLESTWRLYFR